MSFTIDTHVHTSETSTCGEVAGADMARIYADGGYDAIIVCDHYHEGFFQRQEGSKWPQQLDRYLTGFRNARQAGSRVGLAVFPGIELRLKGCNNEYLVFGVDEEFLLAHPRLYELSLFDAHDLFTDAGFLFIQAHPFRPYMTPVDPRLIHGVEAVNGHPNHPSNNPRALQYARDNEFLQTAGSDAHFPAGTCTAGMVFERPLQGSRDFADAVRNGEPAEAFGPGIRLRLGERDH